MKRLLIILGLAYVAGRILGADAQRRELDKAAKRRAARLSGVRYRNIYSEAGEGFYYYTGTKGTWVPYESQEVSHDVGHC